MINKLKKILNNKKILLLGFGREGQSTYKFIRSFFPNHHITIADRNEKLCKSVGFLKSDNNVDFILGKQYLNGLNKFDLIIKSPGISFRNIDNVPKEKISSQAGLFVKLFSKQIIGVTGTKGKSTTVSLIHHIIKSITDDVLLVGNIGVPPFDVFLKIGKETKIVFELSSHQLEYCHNSPYISVMLNLYEEHLDFYKDIESYQLSKFKIYEFQKEDDHFIYSADDENINDLINRFSAAKNLYLYSLKKKISSGCYIDNNDLVINIGRQETRVLNIRNKVGLKGGHNLKNIMAAIIACKLSKVKNEDIFKGLASFIGLKHRMEYIGEYNGIHFYNDSIATIPEATIEAIKAIGNVDTIILGGFDRGIDYRTLIDFVITSEIRNIILIGEAGQRMFKLLEEGKPVNKEFFKVQAFENIKEIVLKQTRKGYTCLLSPAAASYDEFKDFQERGERFKELF